MIRKILLVSAALLVAGCAAAPSGTDSRATPDTRDGVDARRVGTGSYTCENGVTLTIAWGAEAAEVSYAGIQWTLPLARSGSGARYADDKREVWEHQGVVRVTSDEGPPTSCRPLK